MFVALLGSSGQLGGRLLPYFKIWPDLTCWNPTKDELDLRNVQSIRPTIESKRPSLIINAAAYTGVDAAENNPDIADSINHQAVAELSLAAKDLGIPIIHYSTDYVFDGRKGADYTEDDEPNPLSIYGTTKLGGDEQILKNAPKGVIFRTSWVYDAVGSNFYLTMRKLNAAAEAIEVVYDQIGVPNSAFILADATMKYIWKIRKKEIAFGKPEIINLTCGGYTSWFGFAQLIMSTLHKPIAITPIKTEEYLAKNSEKAIADRPMRAVLSNEKAASIGISMPQWDEEFLKFVKQPVPNR